MSGVPALPGLVGFAVLLLWFENVKVAALSRSVHLVAVFGRLGQLAAAAALLVPLTLLWGLAGAGAAIALHWATLAVLPTLGVRGRLVTTG